MEFNENPVTYADVMGYLREFESRYGIASEVYFELLAKGGSSREVDPDDLYEWRSYFDFKKMIESRLEKALQDSAIDDEMLFSPVGGPSLSQEVPSCPANNNLALAA
jgi:hypothetical protein